MLIKTLSTTLANFRQDSLL